MPPEEYDDTRDLPQDIDLEGDDESIKCRYCGEEVYDDADRCPACGQWLEEDYPGAELRSRRWFWPVAVAVLIALILVVWAGLR
ncbi:MAG: zinc ribbon domain-containing protein [Phycisphaerae bacterium]|nr:zinc ribbon domain-containing protein [Phycisphaerae bacterium]